MFLIHDLSHQLALMMILKTWTIQGKIVPQHVGHLFRSQSFSSEDMDCTALVRDSGKVGLRS
jgi:hypothetical protein